MAAIEYIVIHCATTPPSMDIGLHEINQWHLDRGWSGGCGYSYIIRRNGDLETGRAEGEELAHARGFNRNSIAICLAGGVNEHNAPAANFTEAQSGTLRACVDFLRLKYPDANVLGHRDLPGVKKACPSFSVAHWLAHGAFVNPEKDP